MQRNFQHFSHSCIINNYRLYIKSDERNSIQLIPFSFWNFEEIKVVDSSFCSSPGPPFKFSSLLHFLHFLHFIFFFTETVVRDGNKFDRNATCTWMVLNNISYDCCFILKLNMDARINYPFWLVEFSNLFFIETIYFTAYFILT